MAGSGTPPELVEAPVYVRAGIVAVGDYNGDGRPDLAVFDGGVYLASVQAGYGNPPQLLLSSPAGPHRLSMALADAVRREHERRPNPGYSGPADLHLKTATSGDIDGDGDIDLWVESTGGANVESHFLVNNGDGTFTLDTDRAPHELLHNPPPEYWRHSGCILVDLDNDGDLDLALGQLRDLDPTHIDQSSVVLVNGRHRSLSGAHRAAASGLQQRLHVSASADAFRRQRRRVRGPGVRAPAQRRWPSGT